jgi:hypothetical protein
VERLRDRKQIPGSPEAILVDAIKASAPIEPSLLQQQRVLERVLARQRTRHSGAALYLRPVVVVGVLLVAGVTAAATFGHSWIAQGLRSLGSHDAVVAMAPDPAARARRHRTPVAEPMPPPASEAEPVTAPEPAPVATPRATPRPAARTRAIRPEGRTPEGRTPEGRTSEGRTEDPSLVVDAIRALRSDHDSRRAASLLATYLRTYPQGALSEEALVLSIEAAAAGRSPSAATFAAQYLREYPRGRFRRAAEQALEQRQP